MLADQQMYRNALKQIERHLVPRTHGLRPRAYTVSPGMTSYPPGRTSWKTDVTDFKTILVVAGLEVTMTILGSLIRPWLMGETTAVLTESTLQGRLWKSHSVVLTGMDVPLATGTGQIGQVVCVQMLVRDWPMYGPVPQHILIVQV